MQKRFSKNPEIEAVNILLQERIPEKFIITKEDKEKVEKLKYVDYENYTKRVYRKLDSRLIRGNVISNEQYMVALNQKGMGVSKYKDIAINRFKPGKPYNQGIQMYVKNIKSKNIWSMAYEENEEEQYIASFMPDKNEIEKINGNIKSKMENIIVPNEAVEIRKLNLVNTGNKEEILEVTSFFEPVLSKVEQDYAHQAFNNLFLSFDYDDETESILVNRKDVFMQVGFYTESEIIGDIDFEIDKEKFLGRGNLGVPQMVQNSNSFTKKVGLVTDPVVALRRTVRIPANEKVKINLIISVGENKEEVNENLKKYQSQENVDLAFELSKAKVEEESRYLRIKGKDIEQYQKIISYIMFENPARSVNLKKGKRFKQSSLWKYGVSGDLPIIVAKIKNVNEAYVIKEILKAYEYLRTKNIETELVFLDEEKHSYENYVKEEIENNILSFHMGYLKNIKGGIFHISKSEISKEDAELFEFVATVIIDSKKGGIENNLKDIEERYLEQCKQISDDGAAQAIVEENKVDEDIPKNLEYFNEYGGFDKKGKEYVISANKENRLPAVWSHVLANENFGTIVTESMGGYTWYKNCRLNRISTWHNDSTLDIPSEVIYIKDEESKKSWSLGLNPKPDKHNYNVVYGFGYAKYLHQSFGIEQELQVFVPLKESVKLGILKLKNTTMHKKKLKIFQYVDLCLAEDEIKSKGHIQTKYDANNNLLISSNLYSGGDQPTLVFATSSEKISSYTGSKKFFLGDGGLAHPNGIKKVTLNNERGLGKDACIAYEIEVELESFAQKEISIILGAEETMLDSKNVAYKYRKVEKCKEELKKVEQHWEEQLTKVQVETPLESMNIMLNGWAMYQTIASRMLAKTGFYQSGGAIRI